MSYNFDPSLSYGLMGRSGTGKSTLLHMIAGIDQPSHGTIALGDLNISRLSSHQKIEFLQKSVSIVLQQPYLINELTVLENVMLKEIISNGITPESKDRALQLLTEIGLERKADCLPGRLSGGEQQRVAILRAIFHVPQFLLADEPTGNLDEASADRIINLLLHYKKKYAMGLIISTHDIKIAQQCDVILKIE
ncbi:MAG: ATP-binding cassette domain-containing protein, partial [Candidatus Dependentiae bacterium]|nr:ATP-binding cassette domain-containing protein [Candidatus Dependentiae bacterium]